MIVLKEATLWRGTKPLFNDVNVTLLDRERVGVVGRNGSGKSSLFAALLGQLGLSQGEIALPSKKKIVSIAQEIPHSEKSALEYVIDADQALRQLEFDLAQAEKNHDGIAIARLYESLQQIDGFTATARAAKLLHGLGFSTEQQQQPVNALSGGWRMRLNLARALFVPSDILLLDEPTNHLDLETIVFLETWLLHYQGLLLFITHDRELLNDVATQILHIENQSMKLYSGNYEQFERQRAETLMLQEKMVKKQQAKMAHLQAFVDRFRYKASKAKQAQSRLKAIERMEKILPAHSDAPFDFEFFEPARTPHFMLSIEQGRFAYAPTLAPVFTSIDMKIEADRRIGLLGPNGAGKTTLMKLLAQQLTVQSGNYEAHKDLKIGYLAQHTLEQLNPEKSPLDHLMERDKKARTAELRNFLGGFGFSGDMALAPTRHFSGGEKTRLSLALLAWDKPNLLLLDEPTNHLDLEMRQALVMALQQFTGAMVIVSHDRFLLENSIDEFYLVGDQTVRPFAEGVVGYYEYLNQSRIEDNRQQRRDKAKKKCEQKSGRTDAKLKALEMDLAKLQQSITELDERLAELSANYDAEQDEIRSLTRRRGRLFEKQQALEAEWYRLLR